MDQYLEFTKSFCENVTKHHESDDIISMLTHITSPPLIVSTLTKKCFLSPSDSRNIYYEINKKFENLNDLNKKIYKKLEALNTGKLRENAPLQQQSISLDEKSTEKVTLPKCKTRKTTNQLPFQPPWRY